MVVGELVPSCTIEIVPVVVPGVAGVNVTCSVQLAPAGIVPVQSFVCVNAPLLLVIDEMFAATDPRLRRITFFGALATVIVWEPNDNEVGLGMIVAPAAGL